MSPLGEMAGPLLAGYDGSDRSRDGLALVRLLASLTGAEVIALSVITFAPTEATWVEYERMLRDEVAELERDARSALAGLPRMRVEHVLAPSPAHELHDMAAKEGASMIVLGSTHRGPVGRVLPGTVADRLMSAAPTAIAVAPAGYAEGEHPLRAIAVAYDGSTEAALALATAEGLAGAAGASLKLIAVANPQDARIAIPGAAGWAGLVTTQQGIEHERRRVTARLDEALESIDSNLNADGEVVVDTDPEAVIAAAAASADLLVMGSRGYGPMGRVLLGGVASRVLREAPCPVIVTPRPLVEEANGDEEPNA